MLHFKVRQATPSDVPIILQLIRELGEYEKLLHEVEATPEQLHATLFGERPAAEVILAEQVSDHQVLGFALYFQNYSTFLAKPGIYLEDLFVREKARGLGVGLELIAQLARIALDRGCGRFEWSVLDWNQPAIDFYRRIGAVAKDEWTVQRMTGKALTELAARCKQQLK